MVEMRALPCVDPTSARAFLSPVEDGGTREEPSGILLA
jgi:hypothetical protein